MYIPTDSDFAQSAIIEMDAVKARRKQVNDEINKLTMHRDQLDLQASALRQFLRATGALPSDEEPVGSSAEHKREYSTSDEKAWMRHKQDPELADLVYSILDKLRGKQMHYKDIVQEVAATDWPFTENQRSREAWVNRVLNGDGRFIRPSKRGYYSLKKYYPDITRSVGERQRKKP